MGSLFTQKSHTWVSHLIFWWSVSVVVQELLRLSVPILIAHKHPSHENLNHLCLRGNGTTTLKQNQAYFSQIQGQMAISKRNYCDFFVYTHKGYFLERVNFENNYWCQIFNNLEIFFNDYLADELVHNTLREKIDV